MGQDTKYFEDVDSLGCFDVVFISRESGRKLVRQFNSPVFAKQFVRKVKRSKKCDLISYPLFD